MRSSRHRGMAIPTHTEPGTAAPVTGLYQELNVFGTPTGRQTIAQEGEQLPHAPIMFSWRLKSSADCDIALQTTQKPLEGTSLCGGVFRSEPEYPR
jgi:hypothetical protein